MKRSAAEIVREYGPFPGVEKVAGVTYDGQRVYGATALVLGTLMVAFAWHLRAAGEGARAEPAARRLFAFSILYLFVVFAVLLVEHGLGGLVSRMAAA